MNFHLLNFHRKIYNRIVGFRKCLTLVKPYNMQFEPIIFIYYFTRPGKQGGLIRFGFNLVEFGSNWFRVRNNCPKWVTKPMTLTQSFEG